TILATHLSRKTLSRATEMPRLWASCRQIKGPKVVAGDLNTAPFFVSPMVLAGVQPHAACRVPTFPSHAPQRQPDHVLMSSELRPVRCGSVDSPASDHLPLVVDVEYQRTPS
ncbi:MAG: endonuclease/exonuclease/phosphatase family protein, partial [Actinomycetota bacterium]|nr:endonuclease/exonuclease/phosphatase family protein [Actinomycetota bacterium]